MFARRCLLLFQSFYLSVCVVLSDHPLPVWSFVCLTAYFASEGVVNNFDFTSSISWKKSLKLCISLCMLLMLQPHEAMILEEKKDLGGRETRLLEANVPLVLRPCCLSFYMSISVCLSG